MPLQAIALLALALFGAAHSAYAHGDLHLQIQLVSEEIALAPTAALHLKRGGLHHEHGEFAEALADYDRATQLDPTLIIVRFARGKTLFKAGRLPEARAMLEGYLAKKSDHADAFLLRARILSAQKHYTEAVRDFERCLALTPQPLPECFLECAEALDAAGQPLAALAGLDAGIRQRGNLVTFQNAAIALELKLKRHDAALARVDRVLSDLQRKESWLFRRGEILALAGRTAEARQTFTAALLLVRQLPPHHRDTSSMRDLANRLEQKLGS